jgi:hypothetical protein
MTVGLNTSTIITLQLSFFLILFFIRISGKRLVKEQIPDLLSFAVSVDGRLRTSAGQRTKPAPGLAGASRNPAGSTDPRRSEDTLRRRDEAVQGRGDFLLRAPLDTITRRPDSKRFGIGLQNTKLPRCLDQTRPPSEQKGNSDR